LKVKIKLFIVNACQKDYTETTDSRAFREGPPEEDFMIIYSTSHNRLSWRNPFGSHFISQFFKLVRQTPERRIEDIFYDVFDLVYEMSEPGEDPQVPYCSSSMRKKLILYPKH
jgi:hypothetical protein